MSRASPVELRKSPEAATEMARAGIPFVPVPYRNEDEADQIAKQSMAVLEAIEKDAEQ